MRRWSESFIPTLREAPADAEVASHKFLVRAGYIRQLSAGIYSYLFLGNRSFNKIVRIVREEMDRIGQEFYLPALHPRELWEASGRFALMGENLFRLKDRKGTEMCLGMTEEEVMTSIALKELRSYKQLPQIWYQIAPKFRDEPRPNLGFDLPGLELVREQSAVEHHKLTARQPQRRADRVNLAPHNPQSYVSTMASLHVDATTPSAAIQECCGGSTASPAPATPRSDTGAARRSGLPCRSPRRSSRR